MERLVEDGQGFQLYWSTTDNILYAWSNSTGKKNLIQASQATADILVEMGMSHWVTPRKDSVNAKVGFVLKGKCRSN